MALPVQTQLKYWAVAAVVFGLALWALGNVLTPFLIGGAIAYFLDPVADWLENHGFSRIIATTIIMIVGVMMFFLLALLVVPTLIEQAIALFNAAPDMARNLRDYLTERFPQLLDGESTIRKSLMELGEAVQSRGGQLVEGVITSVSSIINGLVLIVIVPVVAFYILMDWDNMIARIDDLLPRDHLETIRRLAREIDSTLASFIRGQGTVCLILGTFYGIALMIAGLQFGVVVGFVAGLISFIPYLGALIGGALAIGLALFQYWGSVEVVDGDTITYATNWTRIAIVGGIFMFGQMLEGNFLTPNLVGNSVGLHPVWLIFALSVFGSIFGFVGLLVAVPLAAMIGVVARFLIAEYKAGLLYQGVGDDGDGSA